MRSETITIEIYYRDLIPKKQKELCESWHTTERDENWDVFPIASIEREMEENEYLK